MSGGRVVDATRGRSILRRSVALGFAVGLLVALASSGSIVLVRMLGCGSARFALAASVLVAGLSALAFSVSFRSTSIVFVVGSERVELRPFVVIAPRVVGVTLGIAVTHLVLQRFGTSAWLSEEPRQFVNDAVVALTILTMMRACGARSFSFVALAIALAIVAMYALTSSLWHVDHPPRAFAFGVQQLVLAEVVSATAALFTTRLMLTATTTR